MMANYPVPYSVHLQDLLPEHNLATSPLVAGLDNNSASLKEGDLFFAYPGSVSDGRQFIDDAIAKGAAAVCYEKSNAEEFFVDKDCVDLNQQQTPLVAVDNLSQQLSVISGRYFQNPTDKLTCIGVTGTNGKTTCAYWLASLLYALGKTTGLVGTVGSGILAEDSLSLKRNGLTTPDAIHLQHLLYDFVVKGASHAVMEVSSHGIEQGRVSGVQFSSALFTNLSRDHLDYHGDMESYAAVKARLFLQPGLQHAVINIDDDYGAQLAHKLEQLDRAPELVTYSLSSDRADVYLQNLQFEEQGITALITTPWGVESFTAPVVGDFNAANLLGVISLLCVEQCVLSEVLAAAANLSAPPGRLQPVVCKADSNLDLEADIFVYVDFAHTPDALEKVLQTLRQIPAVKQGGKLWCVFGCGGDRDKGKRSLMGEVAGQLADHIVVTSDNPRNEAPKKIIQQIVEGIPVSEAENSKLMVMEDRGEAIRFAVEHAQAGDVVLIAGKGHENYQLIKGARLPFDDVQVAQQCLWERIEPVVETGREEQ